MGAEVWARSMGRSNAAQLGRAFEQRNGAAQLERTRLDCLDGWMAQQAALTKAKFDLQR